MWGTKDCNKDGDKDCNKDGDEDSKKAAIIMCQYYAHFLLLQYAFQKLSSSPFFSLLLESEKRNFYSNIMGAEQYYKRMYLKNLPLIFVLSIKLDNN